MFYNGRAMCSIGFETQNFKYRTNEYSRTNAKERTETAIGFIPCYRLPLSIELLTIK